MKSRNKTIFNKSDWLIMGLYFAILFAVSFFDFDTDGMGYHLVNTSVLIVFTLIPIYILMGYIFPRTIELGKYVSFFAITLVVLVVIGYIETWTYNVINNNNWNMNSANALYWGLVSQTENIGMLLSILIAKRLFEAKLDITNLEKEKKVNQLRMLNSQVDPHFLFNNLNTVDTLIDTNPEDAKMYLNRLSKLYRYLTTTKDEEVVLLDEEMDFVSDYIYLIEKRFGSSFQFDFDIREETKLNSFVPPGGIQGLIENAVKHNQGTPDNPIFVIINQVGDFLVVKNNVKEREKVFDSTGNGLDNINARYKLIYHQEIEITKEEKEFIVRLPIIYQSN